MLKERQRLERQIEAIQKKIEKLPEGKLISGRNGKYHQWYQSDGHFRKYIPKKNQNLIQKLAMKKFLSYQLEDMIHEKRAIEFYLKHHRENVGKAEKMLVGASEYQELLSSNFKTTSQIMQEWLQESFEKNPEHKENLIFKTVSGNIVRSKSELMIDTLLFIHKIPFRYECALKLGKRKIYPDFTIMHPKTGKIYYWEHFGMMDDAEYIRKACSKLQLYCVNGIIPSIHLITTFETREHPLGTEDVMKILVEYFGVEETENVPELYFGEK